MSRPGVRGPARPRPVAGRGAPPQTRRNGRTPVTDREGRSMKRRLLAALAASALFITAAVPAGTLAAGPKRQFERLDVSKFDKSLVQQVINGRDVDVIVELDQSSVA